jgi:hypothetical protein
MNNEISPRQDTATHPVTEMTPPSPRRLQRWATAMLARLRRAEKKCVERFRVPPNGA